MISVIMCSQTLEAASGAIEHYDRLLAGTPHEVISILGAQSMAAGYNEGMKKSNGEVLIFTHRDVEFLCPPEVFQNRLSYHMEFFEIVGLAGTNKVIAPAWVAAGPLHIFGQVAHQFPQGISISFYGGKHDYCFRLDEGIAAMDGVFLSCKREAAIALGWDEENFTNFHLYDMDFTYRASKAGFRLGVVNDLPAIHLSPGSFDQSWAVMGERFMQKHGLSLVERVVFTFAHQVAKTRQEAFDLMEAMSQR